MSVVVRNHQSNRLELYIKGADSQVINLAYSKNKKININTNNTNNDYINTNNTNNTNIDYNINDNINNI